MYFYDLKDQWDGGWGRTREEIVVVVHEVARKMVEDLPEVVATADPEFLRTAIL
jgi:hypothetical protein